MSNNEEKNYSNVKIIAVFLLVTIVILGGGVAMAIFSFDYDNNTQTETGIETGDASIETSLTSVSAINVNNLQLIDASEAATSAPSLDFTVKGTSGGKFNVYLKDVAISTNMINQAFKWELVMDGSVIESGDFSDILTNGVVDTTNTSTEQMKYFSRYTLKSNIPFNGNNTSNVTVRIYLLNDPVNDQSSLLGGTFANKVAVEATK